MADRMFVKRLILLIFAIAIVFAAAPSSAQDQAGAHHGRGRIMILMIWDGLRPDLVTQRDTPNLFRMADEGVRFDRHHSIFPTLTMVNATALATGAPPGVNGLEGNVFYLVGESVPAPSVVADGPQASSSEPGTSQPVSASTTSTSSKVTKGPMVSAEGARAPGELNGAPALKARV